MKPKRDFIINHPWLMELVQLSRFDLMARNPNIDHTEIDRGIVVERLNEAAMCHFGPRGGM